MLFDGGFYNGYYDVTFIRLWFFCFLRVQFCEIWEKVFIIVHGKIVIKNNAGSELRIYIYFSISRNGQYGLSIS